MNLPIDEHLDAIRSALREKQSVVLEAPPGAGKTTRVPIALLDLFPTGEILVLEPRRLAARLAATRMAQERGEPLGRTIGYTVRFEDFSSKDTRVRFLTEGILTRRLMSDPTLAGVSCLILDEFHERHLHSDLALAWAKHLQATTRPDLKLVVMSATLETAALGEFLGAAIVRSDGRLFPVEVDHDPGDEAANVGVRVVGAIRQVLAKQKEGDVLVFLPGAREIRECGEAVAKFLGQQDLQVFALHGDLPPEDQDRAIQPSNRRRVILSTNIAESSVTLPNVRAVVDLGLVRTSHLDPWSGVTKLETGKACRSSLLQRSGRAGRVAAGYVLRLFAKGDFDRRPEFDTPEIERTDLTEVQLFLAAENVAKLSFFSPPNDRIWNYAHELLERLGLLRENGLTEMGEAVRSIPLPTRIAYFFLLRARIHREDAGLAAAILAEGGLRAATSFRRGDAGGVDRAHENSDLEADMDAWEDVQGASSWERVARDLGLDSRRVANTKRALRQLNGLRLPPGKGGPIEEPFAKTLLRAFPDRVAKRQRGSTFALVGGQAFELQTESVVRFAEWIVVLDGDTKSGKIVGRYVSAIEPDWLLDLFPDDVAEIEEPRFDAARERVESASKLCFRNLPIMESVSRTVTPVMTDLLVERAMEKGPHHFAPEGEFDRWRARTLYAARADAFVPMPDDDFLRGAMRSLVYERRSFEEMRKDNLLDLLEIALGDKPRRRRDELAPDRLSLPSGRGARVHYPPDQTPYVASRMQDFFGVKTTPTLGAGTPLVLHLLAPNQRAVQITSDLAGFWKVHYPAIRKELMRKYPRHAWPEDPMNPVP
ncbi:MAG: ATP-dependent helicase HrpB [Polyangiaceae bacterium]|nr:ATP-dependent helicase HrpB [Polyangiaceae bacterium]